MANAKEVYDKTVESIDRSGVSPAAMGIMADRCQELMRVGKQVDADSICQITRIEDEIYVFFLVGRSLLAGVDAKKWIEEYHSFRPSSIKRSIHEIATYAAEELVKEDSCIMPFKNSNNKAWRSFADPELLTHDEIRKRAFRKLGRPAP